MTAEKWHDIASIICDSNYQWLGQLVPQDWGQASD
jgi:hypothetical protein